MRIAIWITFVVSGSALVLMPQIIEGVIAANGAWIMGERQDITTMQQIGFEHNAALAWTSIGIGTVLILVGILGALSDLLRPHNHIAGE